MLDTAHVRAALEADNHWRAAFDEAQAAGAGLHMAVFVEPYLRYVLEGRKTVESRFSVHRAPPYGCVEPGDILLIKSAAGPLAGVARVSHVWSYRLSAQVWAEIRERFGPALCLEDEDAFVSARGHRRFATLMRIADVRPLPPLPVLKRDRRGWVVLRNAHDAPFLPGFGPVE